MVSTVIAIIALLASLFSLGWQLARARWERPVVVVRGVIVSHERQVPQIVHAGLPGDGAMESVIVYRMTVVNVGERAVTVVGWGWLTFDRTVDLTATAEGIPDFPFRLEPHDSRTWALVMPSVGTSPIPEQKAEPYARVVQRPTRRELRRGVSAERKVYGAPVLDASSGID
jgi:hypothetical protein